MNAGIDNYFHELEYAFNQAIEQAGGLQERFITLNNRTIQLCFATPNLFSQITPAFEHLPARPVHPPSLTVKLWDSRSSGVKLPDSPWAEDMAVHDHEMLMYNYGDTHMLYNPASEVFSLIDTRLGTAYYHVPDAGRIPYYEAASPMRMILHWWCEQEHMHLIHSAAVGYNGQGVLLAGRGGSGKSTTALAALINGLDYLGDDYVVIHPQDPPRAFSIYSSAKVNPDVAGKLPVLSKHIINSEKMESEKGILFLESIYPEHIVKNIRIQAILIPVVTGRDRSALVKISSARVLAELASSTIFQMPGSGQSTFKGLARMIGQLPAYSFELGRDFSEIAKTLQNFITNMGMR